MVGCCRSFLRDLLNQRSDAAVISEQAVPRLGVAHVHPPQALKRRFRGVIGSALPSGSPRATDRTDTSTPKRAGHGPNPFSQRPIGGCSESSSAGEAGRFQAFYRWCPVLLLSGYEGSPPSAGSGALCCGSKAKEEPPDLPPDPPLLFFQNNDTGAIPGTHPSFCHSPAPCLLGPLSSVGGRRAGHEDGGPAESPAWL